MEVSLIQAFLLQKSKIMLFNSWLMFQTRYQSDCFLQFCSAVPIHSYIVVTDALPKRKLCSINLPPINANRRVKRMLHLPLPKPSPSRFRRRPSRSQPPLRLSLRLLQQKKRTKATRSWQSSRLDKHLHNTCKSTQGLQSGQHTAGSLLVHLGFFDCLPFLPKMIVFLW